MKNARLLPMYKKSSYKVYVPNIKFFSDKILKKEYFSYVHLSTEWWLLIIHALPINNLALGNIIKDGLDINFIPKLAKKMLKIWDNKQKRKRPWKADSNVIERILLMSAEPKPENFYLGVTDNCSIEDLNFPQDKGRLKTVELINATLPKGEIPIHALVFRVWAATGIIDKLINKIKHKPIVIVGPEHLKDFGRKLKLPIFHHLEIHPTEAVLHVEETRKDIKKLHSKLLSKYDDVVYFFVGGSAAMWLVTELHDELENAYLIDIGRALDSYYFYDSTKRKYKVWMFGRWLNKRHPTWVLKHFKPNKNGIYIK